MTRRIPRTIALTAAMAALVAGVLPLTVPAATAAEADSSVTVPIPESWYGVEGAYFTVSKTKNLGATDSVTVTGVLPVSPTSGGGKENAFMQTATAYGPTVSTLTDRDVVAGEKVATEVPSGWSQASRVTATVSVASEFTTRSDHAGAFSSPAGVAVNCKVEQCFLALSVATWFDNAGDYAAANNPNSPALWVPIAFEGGAAELLRDVAPSVTAQPADATVGAGESVTYRTTVAGQPAPTYQWQTSVNDGASWTDVAGATSAELTVAAAPTDDGRLYRAVASNRQGTATTRSAALSVPSAPVEPGADNGRWPLRQPGSWVRLSQYTGLTDGQTITVEASYLTRLLGGVHAIFPFEQGANNYSDPAVKPAGYSPTGAGYIESATYTQVGNVYAGSGSRDYVVRTTLTDLATGSTIDCRVTQCYLAVGGNGMTATGTAITGANTVLKDQIAYVDYRGNVSNDATNTVVIPLYFEGGSLTPTLRSAPVYASQPSSVTVEENNTATFTADVEAAPAATVTWQRSADGGQTWRTIGGAKGETYSPFATPALDGVQYRAVAENALGRTYSDAVTLTVTAAPTTGGTGVTLDWVGSVEMQSLTPARTPNFFSAGVSDGSKATYKNVDGDAKIVLRKADGSEIVTNWEARGAHIDGGQQIARLSNGVADLDASGAGAVSWNAAWTVNFYGGRVPFTLSHPRLTIDGSGKGTLVADLSGYGSSMDDPDTKAPLAPVNDVVVSTFSSVSLHNGTLTVVPDYAGVTFDVPAGSEAVPQVRTSAGWGSWPQGFVDFHFKTGLTSYWYTSGGTADPLKAPLPFTVKGVSLPAATVPVAPAAPTLSVVSATGVRVSWAAPASTGGSPLTGYRVSLAGPDGVEVREVAADATSVEFADLGYGARTASVVAVNAVGGSEPSAVSPVVTVVGPQPNGSPELAGESLFAAPSAGGVSASLSGLTASVTVPGHEGEWVGVSLHSTPVFLGWFPVDAGGVATVPLPAGTTGAHHLVVYAADGSVIGYTAITVAGSGTVGGTGPDGVTIGGSGAAGTPVTSGTGLAATGSDADPAWVFLAVALLLAGSGALAFSRRTRRS